MKACSCCSAFLSSSEIASNLSVGCRGKLKSLPAILKLIADGIGFEEYRPLSGQDKREELQSVISLVVEECASPAIAELFEEVGGDNFVGVVADIICLAAKRGKTALIGKK